MLRRISITLALLLALAPASFAAPKNVGTTAGKTYGEWSAAWWQWIYSLGATGSPLTAEGAMDCSRGQSGPVWFLAGAGGNTTAVRSCTVPSNKALFFPVLNASYFNVPPEDTSVAGKRGLLDGFLSDLVPGFVADFGFPGTRACKLQATLDGERISDANPIARVQSPPFRIDTGDDPLFNNPPNTVDEEVVADGYYVMLPPLTPGAHTLEFSGHFCEFDSVNDHQLFGPISVTYHLTVTGGGH